MTIINGVAENWELIWSLSFDSSQSALPRVFSPTLIEKPVLAIAAKVTQPYWNRQTIGFVNQHIDTGLIGKGLARVTKNRLIFSDELCVVIFPIASQYQLSFDLFLKVASPGELLVYEYIGV
ncbi:hypothetical protein [Microcoleus sp.]|uniref:hypothetical protein n=1 Tax=Microcoleus sp. TaxID=44472 RepID=UPI003523B1EB